MRRPYLSSSIDQLEDVLEAAIAHNDQSVVRAIGHELTFRRVPRAKDLADRVRETMGRTSPPPRGGRQPPRAGKRSTRHKPTPEQEQALKAFSTGQSLRINAFAGSGKTSTLEMLSHSTSRRGQYIAFNKAIVTEAKEKFPPTVDCSTTHSLAFRATPASLRGNLSKMTSKVSAQKLAEALELKKAWRVDHQHVLQPRSQAFLILDTVRRFAQSGDETISDLHVPRHGSLLSAKPDVIDRVNEFARRGADHVWDRMCNPDDDLPLGHDGYLKLWALSNPEIVADFILLDEAQDTNPVVLEVLKKQDAQLVYVGDRHQQIYEWRGAVNAMALMETEHAVTLSQSFRFGPQIAEAASKVLAMLGERSRLIGNDRLDSRVGSCRPDTILSRTNANVMSSLIAALDEGRLPHLVGGTSELMTMLRGVQDLKAGQPSIVPDFFGFQDWREVVEFAETQEGQHLMTFVNLVEARGEKQLIWALNRTVDEDKSDLVLSTAHKAKGREWNNVQLTDDFLASRPPRSQSHEDLLKAENEYGAELRLFYVAITRARQVIDIPPPLVEKLGLKASASSPAPVVQNSSAPSRTPSHDRWAPAKPSIASPPPISIRPTVAPSTFDQPVDRQAQKTTSVASQPSPTALPSSPPYGSPPLAPLKPQQRRGLMSWLFGVK